MLPVRTGCMRNLVSNEKKSIKVKYGLIILENLKATKANQVAR